jgi:hypothetical protein
MPNINDKTINNTGLNINPHTLIANAVSKKIREKNYTNISCFNILKGITLVLYCQAKEEMMSEANIAWGSHEEIVLRQILSKQIDALLGEACKEYDAIIEAQNKLKDEEIRITKEKYIKDNFKFCWHDIYKNKQRIFNGIFDKFLYTLLAIILYNVPEILSYVANIAKLFRVLF